MFIFPSKSENFELLFWKLYIGLFILFNKNLPWNKIEKMDLDYLIILLKTIYYLKLKIEKNLIKIKNENNLKKLKVFFKKS